MDGTNEDEDDDDDNEDDDDDFDDDDVDERDDDIDNDKDVGSLMGCCVDGLMDDTYTIHHMYHPLFIIACMYGCIFEALHIHLLYVQLKIRQDGDLFN